MLLASITSMDGTHFFAQSYLYLAENAYLCTVLHGKH